MDCIKCDEPPWYKTRDLVIKSLTQDHGVKEGDLWHAFITVRSDTIALNRTGKLCIYEENTVIAESSKFTLKARESIDILLSGRMPNRDLYLQASLQAEEFGFSDCEDGQTFFIPLTTVTDPYNPSEDKEEQTSFEWIEENLILVLILVLAIVLIMKLG